MPPEIKSAAGGDWLDEEVIIPGLEPAPEAKDEVPKADAPKDEVPKEEPKADVEAKDEPKDAPKDAPKDKPVDASGDDDAPKADKQIPQQIPKKRFDQVNNRLKEAEKKLGEIAEAQQRHKQAEEAGEAPHDANWFDEREEAYMAAVIDGDATTAKQIRQEIRASEKAQYAAYADQQSQRVAKEVPSNQAVMNTISELQTKFPAMDKASDTFDGELVADVLSLQRGYIQNDELITPAQALEKAAARLGMDLQAVPVPEAAPAPKAEPKDKPASLTDAAGAVDTANAQPPELSGRAAFDNGEDSIDWDAFSAEDLEKLPESKLRELRGDSFRG